MAPSRQAGGRRPRRNALLAVLLLCLLLPIAMAAKAATGEAATAAAAAGANSSHKGAKDVHQELKRLLDVDGDDDFDTDDELAAVDRLHKALDEDNDGTVSFTEMDGGKGAKASSKTTRAAADADNTSTITAKELKNFWMSSTVHGWSSDLVATWIATIGFPQYARSFKEMKIDGKMLPTLAVDGGRRLGSLLHITDEAHQEAIARSIIALVFGVGAAPSSAAHWYIEGLLVAALVAVAAGAYQMYQQQERRHFIERAQLARRVQETSTLVKETENMMEKLKMAAAAERDTEVGKIREALANETKEERQRREVVMSWMQAKFDGERAKFERRFADLQALRVQIESRANEKEGTKGLFQTRSRATRALEDNARLQEYEDRMSRWRAEFLDCLQQWKAMYDLGYINAPGLPDMLFRLQSLDRGAGLPRTQSTASVRSA